MMDRRRFLIVSTCAAGALLLPLQSGWPEAPPHTQPAQVPRPVRMLYGSAGHACAQYPNAVAPPEVAHPFDSQS